MKNITLIIALLVTSFNSFGQCGVKKQPKFAIKTTLLPIIINDYKAEVEYAVNTAQSIEFQVGTHVTVRDATRIYSPKAQFRFKQDLFRDNKNLSGAYFAIGSGMGKRPLTSNGSTYYGNAFGDIGLQFAVRNIHFEAFAGAGITSADEGGRDSDAGCMGCGTVVYGNMLIIENLGLRLGFRAGYQF